jgi:cytochrome c oxidase subunit 3
MPATDGILAEQFDSLEQQEQTATLGMWVFIATEILLFGGLFTAYVIYRTTYPHQFAVAGEHSNVLLGTVNTAILLTSSFFMACAVYSTRLDRQWRTVGYLSCTLVLALAFLALKGLEYSEHISEGLFPGKSFRTDLSPQVELFFWLYFVMTGLHALHVFIGFCVLSVIALMTLAGKFSREYSNPLEVSGLYWHFVDIVWVFLYPLFYLIHK